MKERKPQTIYQFVKGLSDGNKKLLKDYIKNNYVSNIRTGHGKQKNFYIEHNSEDGIEIVKEILKFKRLQNKTK